MVQWLRAFAVKVRQPGFKSLAPLCILHTPQLIAVVWECSRDGLTRAAVVRRRPEPLSRHGGTGTGRDARDARARSAREGQA